MKSIRKFRPVFTGLKWLLVFLGSFFIFCIIYAFTSGPFWRYYHLGTKNISYPSPVDYIILMGGEGMPGEANLIRSYYAAGLALKEPEAKIILAIPGDTADAGSTVNQVALELVMRGIDPERFIFECKGVNTRSQALNIHKLTGNKSHIVVVTSPEHMKRSLLCFKKLGVEHAGGCPAFGHAMETDLSYKNEKLGGNRFIPDVDESISLRYRFWVHLQYEIIIMREYTAISYYKLKGWI